MKSASYETYYIFRGFPELLHAFSNRKIGFSKGIYQSLNIGLSTPDLIENVQKNRRLLFNTLGIEHEQLVIPEQIHSSNVQYASKPGIHRQCDALVSDQSDLFLSVQTADCFPVFLYDPTKKVVGLVHSGWRGTSGNIAGKTVQFMIDQFGVDVKQVIAAVGAGVQQECYQVDEVTARHFDRAYLKTDGEKHFKLNLRQQIVDQLITTGIPERQIEQDKTCTHCADERYYSYRRDGKHAGRMMGIIGVKK